MAVINGVLKVHPGNPRYFADGTGKAVYLTGAHTWFVLQDGPEGPFDYDGYLEWMVQKEFNFMRFWCQEGARDRDGSSRPEAYAPSPFMRTGPGLALDGLPKYDLTKFDQAYFDRLADRVEKAGRHGIYTAVMLFQGWGIERKGHGRDPWPGHAFHRDNNANFIDGDPAGTGEGTRIQTLEDPAATELQRAYARKVVDTVNGLDNVLYEISNESANESWLWQYEMIRCVKDHERTKPKQHPVLMTYTFPHGMNQPLYMSAAEGISPGGFGIDNEWNLNPPDNDGRKVVFLDTDHIGGIWGCVSWVWKCLTRGIQPIFMDDRKTEPWKEPVFDAMRDAKAYADKIDLAHMIPSAYMTSTGYCLAKPNEEFLIYQPEVAPFTVKLMSAAGLFEAEWYDPGSHRVVRSQPVQGGEHAYLAAPFRGDAVLYLKRKTV